MTPGAGTGRLRILHVSEVHWGGVVTLLRHFAAEQSATGHDVHVLAPAAMGDLPGAATHTWELTRGNPSSYPGARAGLRRLVDELRPDVVHLHSFIAGFFGRLPGSLPSGSDRPAVIYQPHAWSFELVDNAVVRTAIRRWERYSARRADLLVANCWDEVEEGRRAGVRLPAHELGVAVDLTAYHPVDDVERHRQRDRLGLGARTVVVCLGRIARQKGQDLLLPVWERRPPPGTVLVLVGPGDTTELSRLAPTQWRQSILAVGEQDDVRPWLWASDMLVMPSRYETVGLVVAEAMACERPVVAWAVNGARTTVLSGPPGPGGAVVDVGDAETMMDELTARAACPETMRSEGEVARARAERLFPPPLVVRRLNDAYSSAIARDRTDKAIE